MVPLVATLSHRARRRSRELRSLHLIRNSLSARKVDRSSPVLAGLHRVASGALAGLGLSVLTLSALTLHWQNEWARSYSELEASRSLEHQLQESSALLEQHHLSAARRPGLLVPTSSEKLIHLPEPSVQQRPGGIPLLAGIHLRRIPAGY